MNRLTKELSSIEAYKKYNIAPSYLRFMVNNLFYFPDSHRDLLTTYTLTAQYTDDFLDCMNEGVYMLGGVPYQVIYYKTDPSKLLRRAEYTSVKLSFRVTQPEFNILPTVLVKEIR